MLRTHNISNLAIKFSSATILSVKKITVPACFGTLIIETGQNIADNYLVGLTKGEIHFELSEITTSELKKSPSWIYELANTDLNIIDEHRCTLPVEVGGLASNFSKDNDMTLITITRGNYDDLFSSYFKFRPSLTS